MDHIININDFVAGRQRFSCINKPGSNISGLKNYNCPMWNRKDSSGIFDESCYKIWNIMKNTKACDDDKPGDLRAVCICCYEVLKLRAEIENEKCDDSSDHSSSESSNGDESDDDSSNGDESDNESSNDSNYDKHSKAMFSQHVARNIIILGCRICGEEFIHKDQMIRHIRRKHNE